MTDPKEALRAIEARIEQQNARFDRAAADVRAIDPGVTVAVSAARLEELDEACAPRIVAPALTADARRA